jgi:hypothetical protein
VVRLPGEESYRRLDDERIKQWLTNLGRRGLGFLPTSWQLTRVVRALADEANTRGLETELPAEVYRLVLGLPLLQAILEFMRQRSSHTDHVADWLKRLKKTAGVWGIDTAHKTWPRVPWVLGRFFRDNGPLLMALGFRRDYGANSHGYVPVTLTKVSSSGERLTSESPGESPGGPPLNSPPNDNLRASDPHDTANDELLRKLRERRKG